MMLRYHYKFRKVARNVSKQFPNTIFYDTLNLYEYYKFDKNKLENDAHKEYITKFKRVKQAYSILEMKHQDGNLLDISVIAYNSILKDCNGYGGIGSRLYLYCIIFLFDKSSRCYNSIKGY